MKIKNTLFENKFYFKSMEKIHQSEKLSVMDAYQINRLVKKVNELYEEYQELKLGLLKKYGEPDKESEDKYIVGSDKRNEFTKEYMTLLDIEHDLETEKLPFPSKIDEGITVSDIDVLNIFFDFGFDKDDPAK